MELNREQIIKALECCVLGDCFPCDYHEVVGCRESMCGDALLLIKELTEENERLKARVLEENHLRHQAEEMLANGMSVVKADTVRKMQERLYRELAYLGVKDKFNKEFFLTKADQVAKEMLEGL